MDSRAEIDARLREIDRLLAKGGIRRGRPAARPKPRGKDFSSRSAAPIPRRPKASLKVLRAAKWTQTYSAGHPQLAWLAHGFSTRTGGLTKVYSPSEKQGVDLNLGLTPADDPATVAANRKLFLRAVSGDDEFSLITLKQIHSSLVRRVTRARSGAMGNLGEPAALKGDGLMTDKPGVLLGIQTADCLPVLIADPRNRAVAVLHAGWRGTLARIVEGTVGRMRLEFGSKPEDLLAAIGPGIGACCYAVGEDIRQQFESQFVYAAELFCEVYDSDPIKEKYPMLFLTARAPGHSDLGPSLHLDLAEANRRQLLSAGLRPTAIEMAGACTACHPAQFFSHRGERGFTGRMMTVIGIRK